MAIFNTVYGGVGGVRPLKGLIAYYPFNEDMKDHKSDLGVIGVTYDCTAGGGTYTYPAGKVDNCIYQSVNGQNKAIDTGISLGNVYSLSAWIKLPSVSGWKIIGGNQYPDEGAGFRWQFQNGNLATGIKSSQYSSGITLSTDTWYQYTITQNGTELKQYVNGELKATNTVDSTAGATTLKLLGRGDNEGSQCYMDDVLVYNRILTADEVSTYYNATK